MTINNKTTLAMALAFAVGSYGLMGPAPAYAAGPTVATAPDASDAAEDAREAADRANDAAEEANEAADYAADEAKEDHHDIIPTGALSRMQIIEKLTAAGYTDIHDLEYGEDGVWKAEANEPNTGEEVDLWIDGVDGHIIKKNDD